MQREALTGMMSNRSIDPIHSNRRLSATTD